MEEREEREEREEGKRIGGGEREGQGKNGEEEGSEFGALHDMFIFVIFHDWYLPYVLSG